MNETPLDTHLIKNTQIRKAGGGHRTYVFYVCGLAKTAQTFTGTTKNRAKKWMDEAAQLRFGTHDLANVTCAECRRRALHKPKSRYVEPEPKPPVAPLVPVFAESWDDDTPIGGKP